jgi:DNA-binding MarR family transcriptional regulator
MSAAQLFVLRQLAVAGTYSIGELAARTLTHPSSVSVVVTRLVGQGLAERHDAADDRRRVDVSCTAAGHARLADAPRLVQDRLVEALAAMDPPLLTALAQGLDLLAARLGDSDEGATVPMFFEGEDAGEPVTAGPDVSVRARS